MYCLISLFFFISTLSAASITPNYKSSCTLLDNKIYCYSGGYVALGDQVVRRAIDEHHYLDLAQTLVLDETSAKWISIPDDTHYTTEASLAGTATPISPSHYVLDGGYNGTPSVKNITRVFDARNNGWSTITNVNRSLDNAIYMGTAAYVASQGKIYYWGGLTQWTVSRFACQLNYHLEYAWATKKNAAWSICPSVLPLGTFTRFGHTATLDNDGINIFYIGGRIRTAPGNPNNILIDSTTNTSLSSNPTRPVPYYNIIPMNDILTYNTIDATWNLRRSPSTPSMSSRYMHTANLLPYSGKILIYGGATDDGNEKHPSAVSDYLYLFDTKTLEYSEVEDNEKEHGAGPRFGHSAILCNNTLFVLFGVNQKGLITNDVYFLSLSGSASWLKSFSGSNIMSDPTSSLSKKAIIGISIGSVLVFILLVTAIGYIVYSRYHDQAPPAQVPTEGLPQLHKEYQRFSSASFDVLNSPNEYTTAANMPIYVDISSDSATLHDSLTPPRGFSFDHLPQQKPHQLQPSVVKPSAI